MSEKIRVYYSIPEHFPPFRVDISELVATSLAQKGVDTDWYMGTDEDGLAVRNKKFLKQNCTIPPKLAGRSFFAKAANKCIYWVVDACLLVKASFSDYQIVQVRDKYFAAIIGLLVAKICRKPYVYWCSYPYPEHTIEMAKVSKGFKRAALLLQGNIAVFLLYKVVMKYADHSFVQSDQMLSEIKKLGVQEKKMTPVPMGVPEKLLEWVNTKIIPVNPKTVVYLGTLAAVRRLHTIIEAFSKVVARHQDAKLMMVGEGNTPLERLELEQYATELEIEKNVIFTGFVPIDKAWEIAASGALCLSPIYPTKILNVGSPTKLIEYLALGRPVVCNNHPEQSMIIQESGAGLCVDWSAQAFAEAIISLLDDPETAQAMAAKGPVWVRHNRAYNNIADTVLNRYKKLAKIV